ncbi:multidrug resistance-associated protein 4 [Anopheles stephensi]|uniref:multidrug resistance-associated protein 4 n=1 Tax=Anopheles stephensi TaxID=30069 RepID=UPI0016589116|nr:multidrug resistance-associated protein 4 [Anopheles stephensi]XP_035901950.1 multidrug resistance-associated protein 4 [Anopheles stephensi]XP_035901951.1 multidrug resistance-associated protein 4 [Anopheles stephensi]XP_035901952.1 multidrug resistance-associated protein 4 [Anopheles stephensi]XP_035901953.1 multidrug resistance-associated protein 4 [Anopheles stephensi]XP_035901954.1 multidrug resistance-associated protein 4 [Anopheles stephensi]XP_035901955.1 multidrug resistance-assoc
MNRENAFSSGKQNNPIQNASFFSRRSFWWLREMFRYGQRKEITEEKLYATLPEHSSHRLAETFERLWSEEEQLGPDKASFARVYWRAFGKETLFWGLMFSAFETANRVAQPLLLGELVSYFTPNQDTISERDAYLYAIGVITCSLLSVISFHPFIFYIFQLGMKFRIGASCLIYNKVLKLSKSTTAGDGLNGKIINLLSNDVGKFDIALCFVHDLWKGPMEAILLGYFIYCQIGFSGLLGMAFLMSFIPLQAWVGKKTATYRMKAAKRTDLRVRFMNEIIQGIQVIKMYTWESSFAKMIETIRRKEIQAIRGGAYVRATLISFFTVSRVSIFISLLSYTVTENVITAKKVFIVTSFYSILNDSMVHFWPMAITFCAEGYISLKRIRDFLLTPEGKPSSSVAGRTQPDEKGSKSGAKKAMRATGDKDGTSDRDESKGIKENTQQQNGSIKAGGKSDENDSEPLLPKRLVQTVEGDRKGIVLDSATARWMCPSAAGTAGIGKDGGDGPDEVTNVGIESVSLTVEPGRLCVLVGPVGSGKSTLLQVLLGELELDDGRVEIYGSVSYAAQEPWLFEGSVRNNILFTEAYDERRYLRVVRVCALEKDFELFPHGDQTIVGERGISLSGGQKARVNLARAIYRKADIYLLDDPLSAVDTHVGKHIYELCIRDFLANTVCVLVTHQLQYLKDVQQIVLMNGGRVEATGSFRELKKSNIESIMALTPDESPLESPIEKELKNLRPRRTSGSSTGSQRDDLLMDLLQQEKQEEEKESQGGTGSVGLSVYKTYIKAVNSCGWVFWLSVLMVLSQIVVSGVDIFVAEWVNWEEKVAGIPPEFDLNDNHTILSSRDVRILLKEQTDVSNFIERQQYIWIYSGLIILLVILVVQRSFSFFYVCLRISVNLHDRLFRGLTRATMHFFNTNPSGRILNRFSKDIGAIDSALPMALLDCVVFFLEMIAVVAVVSIVNYWFLLPTAIVAVVMYYIRKTYLNTSRVVKRIESVNRSPLFSHTNATLQGLSTIRACGAQSVLRREFNEFLDVNSSAWYMFIATSRAFALWLDMVCVLYIGIVTISFLVGNSQQMLGGSVGLAITKTISLVGMCQWGMRQSAELENQMVSVERVNEYTNLPSEPPLETAPKHRPQRNWPEFGTIRFTNVDLRYTEDGERVLKDLNFTIRSNEKVGIVGRTGAGKSSLIQALFRLAPFEGNIEIDDIDTKTLGLRDLRNKISIIPQDPILFSGTLRSNLDPFDQRKDDELWNALDEVELKEAVSSLAGGLECRMSDGGSNFSMGQRQLVCLARAILRNNKILVLDEATANVDPETDKLIQTTIRTKFAHCTVLTIAHRLHTVMDSDRVLVMDAGRVVEFGHPHELLHGPIGYLRRLVDQTGVATAAMLMRTAEDNFKKSSARQTEAITLGLS